jgi:hypothetical protein
MKIYVIVDIYIYVFLTLTLFGGEWSASRPGHFTPWDITLDIYWIEALAGPRTGLNNMEMRKRFPLLVLELQPLRRPSHSQ